MPAARCGRRSCARGYDGGVTEPADPSAPAWASAGGRPSAGARAAGLLIDWVLCMLISSALFPVAVVPGTVIERVLLAGQPLATLGLWAVQHLILVATIGTTIGHRIVRLRVVRADGGSPVGLGRAAARTALIALVIPALAWDEEGRGLHDRAAGTALVRVAA